MRASVNFVSAFFFFFFVRVSLFYLFLKLFFIDYAIVVVLILPHLAPSTQYPLLPQAIPTPLFMSMGHVYKFFGYSISYAVLYIPMAIL